MPASAATASLEELMPLIRPSVRAQHPYLVATPPSTRVKLNQNESPYDLPAPIRQELVEALGGLEAHRYPSEQPYALIEALAAYTGHPPEGLIVGNGSNELTYTLGLCFITPGAPVLLPQPMFSLYEKVVRLYDGALTSVPPRADLSFDTEALLEAIEAVQPALTVVTTPNNPTGLAMPFAEVEAIVQASPGFVVVDEAYVEFNEEPSAQTLLQDHPNVLVMRTFSKAFGLAGVRLGYLMAHPDVAREIAKSRLPFMVDRLAEQAALALLRRPALIEERVEAMKTSCAQLHDALAALPSVDVMPTSANFLLFRTPHPTDTMLARLSEQGVLIRNMSGYADLKGYMRVNAGTSEENNTFLAALERALH
ncbi:MAG: histidinol-phosphate transaminase [Bacteroidota bacterium]